MSPNPRWLAWAQRLQALAQSGITYSKDPYDIERYHQIIELAAEIVAEHGQADLSVVQDLFAMQSGYITPKLDIRGVVFRDDQILLVQERADGLWTLPGGWVDVNEPPSDSVEREVWEESGYHVRAVKLLALYDRNLHGHPPILFHTYKIFVLCELTGGEASASLETLAAGFFLADDLPPLSILRTTEKQILRMFDLYQHPDWPADFD